MKKLLLSVTLFAGILATGSLKAQTSGAAPDTKNKAIMKFETDTINYGTIAHNADGYRYFKFTNVGTAPLIITEAHGSCGCTVPTPPTEPIQPGSSSQIKVHYATDRVGAFTKTVTVTSNAEPGTKVLVIKGTILPDPTPAPGSTPATTTPTTTAPAGK